MAPIEVNGGAAAEKPSKHNKVVIIGSGPAGRESLTFFFVGDSRRASVQEY